MITLIFLSLNISFSINKLLIISSHCESLLLYPSQNFQKFKKITLRYLVQDSHLFCCQGRNISLCHVVDLITEWNRIIQTLHDEFRHKNQNNIYVKISQQYWWEEMYNDIREYMKTCNECQWCKRIRKKKKLHFI